MSDERISGRRAAPPQSNSDVPDGGDRTRRHDEHIAAGPDEVDDPDEQNIVQMWSGPVSVRQPSAFIAVDDALVAPTDYQTAARQVIQAPQQTPTSRRALGVLALVIALGGVGAEALGIGVASAGDDLLGTVLAVIAIALTAFGAALGIVAIILRRGRLWGVGAAVLGILANPLLLVLVLGALAPAAA